MGNPEHIPVVDAAQVALEIGPMNAAQSTTKQSPERLPTLSIDEAAELEGLSYAAYMKRLIRKRVVLAYDDDDRRRKVVPLDKLTPKAYSRWLAGQAASTNPAVAPGTEKLSLAPVSSQRELQSVLQFEPPTETERKLAVAVPPGISKDTKPYIDKWTKILGDARNGSWERLRGHTYGGILINGRRDFVQAIANLHGVGASTVYARLEALREIECDPSVPDDRKQSEFWNRILPKPRPGRSGHSFFADAENSWAYWRLRDIYLNQAKLSEKRAHELLCAEIEAKQRAWGVRHLYEKPTLKQCRTILKKVDLPTLILAREGEKAYSDRCAPYISRRPPAHANDIWVTDQRLGNVRLRDGGNRLGRIWVVNFLDVTSWRWLGCMFGPLLNSDVVMWAAAMSLERAGVPCAVHMDLGKEFTGKRFLGGIFTIRGETLFRDALGLWQRLGVKAILAIGRNPQSKIIERWHRELDRFDQELPGWCGSNPDERPEKLAEEEAAHRAWLETGRGRSPLLGIPDYIKRYLDFCEGRWNGQHRGRGKYLQGMTPIEVWNTRLPEGGLRTLTREQVDFHTADHRILKVARGGQVNLTFHGQTIEYVAPELFTRQGEEVEVVVSRRSLRQVTVVYKLPGGTNSCVAHAKPLHGWLPENREELRQALRCRAALKRAVKHGIEASKALLEANTLRELPAAAAAIAPEIVASFAAPGPRPEREISGAEYMTEKLERRMEFYNEPAEDTPAKKSGLDFADVV